MKDGDAIVYSDLSLFSTKAGIGRMKRQLALDRLSSDDAQNYFERISL